jgi:hypothetical protein
MLDLFNLFTVQIDNCINISLVHVCLMKKQMIMLKMMKEELFVFEVKFYLEMFDHVIKQLTFEIDSQIYIDVSRHHLPVLLQNGHKISLHYFYHQMQ